MSSSLVPMNVSRARLAAAAAARASTAAALSVGLSTPHVPDDFLLESRSRSESEPDRGLADVRLPPARSLAESESEPDSSE